MAREAHGIAHSPEAEDPVHTGRWHYVGGAGEPALEAGANAGGTSVPLRFRIAVGRPNVLDELGNIVYYCDKQLDVQGDVTGVTPGDILFHFPKAFWLDYDVPLDVHDDLGNHVPCRVYAVDGRFVYGVP